jgi:uncharacterized protein (DUF1697 family)
MEPFLHVGLKDVAAYQAAGNITFRSEHPEAVLTDRLQAEVSKAYGFETTLFLRTETELRALARARPFSDHFVKSTEGRIQVSFLQTAPEQDTIADVLARVPLEDRLVFLDRHWLWLPLRGISESRLPVVAIEKLAGPMTIRSRGTIERMVAKFGGRGAASSA